MFRLFVTLTLITYALTNCAAAAVTYHVGSIQEISQGCAGSAEVEQAVDSTQSKYVYEAWIGCGGIGFARSTDGGVRFSAPIAMPLSQSSFSWDPTVAVGPDGTLYVGYMLASNTQMFPVVAASFDHGISFPQVTQLLPPDQNNWGDRVFLATAPDGAVYATWDYGPFNSYIQLICSQGGSCSYSYGDLNAVVQKSTDRGMTFGDMVHVSPDFPGGGAEAAPMVVESSGQIDTYYQADRTLNQQNFRLAPWGGHFTSSVDGGAEWSKPIFLTSRTGRVALQCGGSTARLASMPATIFTQPGTRRARTPTAARTISATSLIRLTTANTGRRPSSRSQTSSAFHTSSKLREVRTESLM